MSDAITLRAPGVAVTIDPTRGGRITHLTNLDDGREWLHRPDAPRTAGAAYDDGDLGGWDEMLPTIAACPHPDTGEALADHGDLWDQSWDVVACDADSLTLRVRTRRPVVTLERTVRVRAHGVRLDYAAASATDVTVLWAAHPLFATQPSSRVVLDPRLRPWRAGDAVRAPFAWPSDGLCVANDIPSGSDVKLFADASVCSGTPPCGVVDASGSRVDLRWDVVAAPYLGLWLDHANLVTTQVAALEPTTGPDDALDAAQRHGAPWVVPAGRTRRWWVEVMVDAGDRPGQRS